MVNIKINNIPYQVKEGSTILEAAREAGFDIPTLCYMKDINAIGACRICVVEVKGARSLVTACVYPVNEGMEVFTNTAKVLNARKMTLELLLSNHKRECLTCLRSGNCELQALSHEYGLDDVPFEGEKSKSELDHSVPHLVRDNEKCILCRRCIAVCRKNQDVGVLGANDRGFDTHIGCAFDMNLGDSPCVNCGQCTVVCPTGALTERDDTEKVWAALNNPDLHVVVGTAPSVRATLGECFDLPVGTNVEGKMVSALRRMGFAKVFDVDTAADMTIMEEGTELIERLNKNENLPIITSCSPGWVKYCEYYFPEFLKNVSSCKSPQQMFGALIKTYYAQKAKIDPKKIFVVSVMPCTAKKYECEREEQKTYGIPDVDVSITTRELGRMIKKAGIRFTELPDETFDAAFGIASGAAHIFGVTGGVTEAALRTVYEILTGKTLTKLEFENVRGLEGVKRASVNINGTDIKIAVTSGLANAKKLLDKVKSGEEQYHLIEVMACPGGCINGGGQPIHPASVRNFTDLREARAKALYSEDAAMNLRKSHENPVVKTIYGEFLGEPGSHKSHEILHTHYVKREKYAK